jgi:hypothetical protein
MSKVNFLRIGFGLALVSIMALMALAGATAIELAVDTAIQNQDGLLVLYGGLRLGGEKGLPVAAGDINGDGRADVIFCEMYGSAGSGSRKNNGLVNFYISDGRDSGFVDAAKRPANIFTLVGASSGDLLGTSVATGDVNGDGIADVIIGASGSDGPGASRFNCGAAYVVPGSRSFNLNADLLTLDGVPPVGITVIYGPQVNGRFGIWADAGDVDGDGIADIVIGSDQINSSAGQHVGGAYIIFGSRSLPKVIDLASPPAGVRIARIIGAAQEDHWGAALHVGDINNDGIGDLVIGASIFRDSASYVSPEDETSGHNARGASFGGRREKCGEAYVLYGSRDWPAQIDLARPPANATHIIGAKPFDFLGSQLFSADINGDGKTDLIVGALQADAPDGRGRTGAVYVIYGSPQIVGATIDAASPDSSGLRVTAIYGEDNLDCAGDSVRAYDINRDGMAELFIGSPEHTFEVNGEEREDAGDTKFIFGQREFLPPLIKLYDPPAGLRIFRLAGAHGAQQGVDGGDEFSYRLTGGDVDGDGFPDYVANAMHGDGFDNSLVNAGNVYIFSGKKLSAKLGMLAQSETPPTITSAKLMMNGQAVQEAMAGASGLTIVINGTGFKPGRQVFINGMAVISSESGEASIVFLDQNPSIRNNVGPLVVQVRNTNPPSELSNAFTAGRLIGPEIVSISAGRKESGAIILKVRGANFQDGDSITATDANNQQIMVRSVTLIDSSLLKAKLSGAVPAGTLLRVRVVTPAGVQSNEVSVAVP